MATLTGKTIGELTLLTGITNNTLFPVEYDSNTYHIPFSSITNYIEVVHNELLQMRDMGMLTPSNFYLITDFQTCYDQPNFDYNDNEIINDDTYKVGPIQPIMVLATSESTLSTQAYQPTYPNDTIKYDILPQFTEATDSPCYGRITERIDEYGNRTDYDHRVIKFKRYKSYILNSRQSGKIVSIGNPTVLGENTTFTEFTVGDVIYIASRRPKFYQIIEIVSDTEMNVAGFNFDYTSEPSGYYFWSTYAQGTPEPGTLYYFNDVGTNNIDDGGNDMYDGGNTLNTNLSSNIPYTHTQMVEPPINSTSQASYVNFTYDGSVQDGSSYFNSPSQYFTNLYPGLFVMAAYDISINEFFIHDNLGADGGGNFSSNSYEYSGYSIYTKSVYAAQDPSVTHLFIVNTIDGNIVHTPGDTGDDTNDVISNITGATQIHYLLFALAGGINPTEEQIQNVYESYISTIHTSSIDTTLFNLNNNFTGITSNLPANNTVYLSYDYKQTNIPTDTEVYRELYTFDYSKNVKNNYIGNYANLAYDDFESNFILSNNVFLENAKNNTFGNGSPNNTFTNYVEENVFDGYFSNNVFTNGVTKNVIGTFFRNNSFLSSSFDDNKFGVNTYGNNVIKLSMYRNNVGNEFQDNTIVDYNFQNNRLGNSFNTNFINYSFYKNNVGVGFNNNTIWGEMYGNLIGNGFNHNNIYSDYYDNLISEYFNYNTIGRYDQPGNYSFYRNQIGTYFENNVTEYDFQNNEIGSGSNNNRFSNYFYKNDIGNGFNHNNISGETYGNIIGNGFNHNTIYSSFYENVVREIVARNTFGDSLNVNSYNVYGNSLGNYFQYNTVSVNFFANTFSYYADSNIFIGEFSHNQVADEMNGNTFSGQSSYNIIGSGFYNNKIGAGFGFGYSTSQGNTIGNYFYNNTIGEYFYNNVIADGFYNNTVVDYFQLNDVKFSLSSTDFTTSTHVYGNYNCTLFLNQTSTRRLSYYDGSDVLTITNITD